MMVQEKKAYSPLFKICIKWMYIVFAGIFSSIIIIFLLIVWGVFGKLPTFEEIENPEYNLATEIISSDGVTLGKYAFENRTPISYKDLSPYLVNALIATEDERFFDHFGIDFISTFRAVTKLGNDGGASTITQQLAKNLFHKRARGVVKRLIQKLKEWIIAIRLERQYTKKEIIAMYFNQIDFLNNAIGIRSATNIYFGKAPGDVNIEEAAVLVGMLKNPSFFNPLRRPEIVEKRRNVVLSQMNRNDFITKKVKDSLQGLPLKLDINKQEHYDGYATYFREYLRDYMKDWINKNPKDDGERYNLYRDGLKIYVTINSKMQMYAEEAMKEHMANLQNAFFKEQKLNETAPFYNLEEQEIDIIYKRAMKNSERWRKMEANNILKDSIELSFKKEREMRVFTWKGEKDTIMTPMDSIKYYKHFLHTGVLSIEPESGHIKAWVGGINYKHFQYDHVEQGARQVGSTFKPFVYASAIDQLNLSPCDKYENTPYTIPKGKYGIKESWTPKNSDDRYGGVLSLKEALAKSKNVITARLIDKVKPEIVVRLAKKAGITTNIKPNPSISLGAVDITLFDMVGAYASFANKGLHIAPMVIERIEDKDGRVLSTFTPKTSEVMNEDSAYIVLDLLKGVTEFGSGVRLRTQGANYPDSISTGYPYMFKNPIAGKTGTTQSQSDGWFIGVVPNLATGVWVGGEDRATHFKEITKGQGASMALPIWAIYYKKLYDDKTLDVSQEDFEKPEYISIRTECNSKTDRLIIDDQVEEIEDDSSFDR